MKTDQATSTTPEAVCLTAMLGPAERQALDALLDHIYEYGTTAEGVLKRAATLCQAARADERERCVRILEAYRVPVGNSAAGEMAADWTMEALHEIRAAIRGA